MGRDVDVDEFVAGRRASLGAGIDRTTPIKFLQISDRKQLTAECPQACDNLDHAATSAQIADVAFGRRHVRLFVAFAEDFRDCLCLLLIALLRPEPVRMNVPD